VTEPTPAQVLALELDRNDAGAATVGDYLIALLASVWSWGEEFNSKRPFGNSGWENDLFRPLVRAGYVAGTITPFLDMEYRDEAAARALIASAIEALRPFGV
jgi:hypothetical protein